MVDSNDSKNHLYFALSQVDRGRIYLKSALEKGQEQDIISALHNIIDAILWDINQKEQKN
ncbi:MAG: hypothetical protein QNJ34_12315 [Xenococcaceae cyanobacterium MO_188.B29]|nr:hypothetical protein [Xenococcaceae cyanobacterium MO_188.B29]